MGIRRQAAVGEQITGEKSFFLEFIVCHNFVAKRSRINYIQYNTLITKFLRRAILFHYKHDSLYPNLV